ncbi:MAG: MarR family winged helix-turn-helix transcriptional regulator [Candidatus Eiseniibacteriota bacterium]
MSKRKPPSGPAKAARHDAPAPEDLRDFAPCAGCMSFALRRAARAMSQHYAKHLRPTGLRGTQFTMLATLVTGGPMPISRMARRLGLERTTLTRNLKPLEAKGWIAVTEDEDRRVHVVSVTAKGRAMARKALPAWHKAQETARAKIKELRLDVLFAA